jgi:uncharacterized protein YdeI (YjbR/CyaY-like superfamily)
VAELEAEGLMRPAGLEAFRRRTEGKSRTYAYEQRRSATLAAEHEKRLRSNQQAWAFFAAQAPSYRCLAVYRVVSARKEETRLKRLERLIEASARGRRRL